MFNVLVKTFAKLTDTIVVATIHQPNWETFSQFNEVLFLSGGHCMYQGPIGEYKYENPHCL